MISLRVSPPSAVRSELHCDLVDGTTERGDDFVDVPELDHVGRTERNRVSERSGNDSPLQESAKHTNAGLLCRFEGAPRLRIGDELNGGDHSETADLADDRFAFELLPQALLQVPSDLLRSLVEPIVLQYVQVRQRDGSC